jgi:hypothetical protein
MRNVNPKLRALLTRVAAFLAPAAFEARARRREQLKLRRELAEVDETLAWCNGRRAFAEERLRKLEQEDSAATLAAMGIKPGSLLARQAESRASRKPVMVAESTPDGRSDWAWYRVQAREREAYYLFGNEP